MAALPVLAELCLPLVKVGGAFLAMKSVGSEAELAEAKRALETLGGRVEALRDYCLPGTDVRHRLVIIKKNPKNPGKIPQNICKDQEESLIIENTKKV